jgi:hypothetical protein
MSLAGRGRSEKALNNLNDAYPVLGMRTPSDSDTDAIAPLRVRYLCLSAHVQKPPEPGGIDFI